MLTNAQEKLIRSVHTKKGRINTGLCLVEGEKMIETAGKAVTLEFSRSDSRNFDELVTTDTPQDRAALAHIPNYDLDDITSKETIVVLDGVQDPGNVGAAFRLCLAFNASLLIIESADPASPKVIRSSVGTMFQVPWKIVKRADAKEILTSLNRPIFKLEKSTKANTVSTLNNQKPAILIAGSEGSGITLPVDGSSVFIEHNNALDSLNVGNALAIALYARTQ